MESQTISQDEPLGDKHLVKRTPGRAGVFEPGQLKPRPAVRDSLGLFPDTRVKPRLRYVHWGKLRCPGRPPDFAAL